MSLIDRARELMELLQHASIKVGALFSYCGGPLILGDILKPRLGTFMAFGVTFVPILLMVLGAGFLFSPSPRRRGLHRGSLSPHEADLNEGVAWGILLVRLGLVGALVTLLMHAYGAWVLSTTAPRPDHRLYVFGIVVGIPLAGVYVYLARRWLNGVGVPEDAASPIEPR